MSENSSELILTNYLNSVEGASEALFNRYHDRAFDFAKKKLGRFLQTKVDPGDIAHESLVSLFRAARDCRIRINQKGDLWKFLVGIINNKVKSQFERFNLSKRNIQKEQKLESDITGRENSETQTGELFADLIRDEKPVDRKMVELLVQGYSQKEIAEKLGRTTRTIRRMMENLRAKVALGQDLPIALADETIARLDPGPTQVQYEDYCLRKMIGMGDFAKVYLARHKETNTRYAFKAVRKKWLNNSTVRSAFVNEAHKLMTIDDRSVVNTYGYGKLPNGGMFLILEWIDGISLAEALPGSSRRKRRTWLQQLEQVVIRIHRIGVSHRDLNPRNVLISRDDNVVLIDFAFSRQIRNVRSDQNEDLAALRKLRQCIEAIP